ncbi:MAG TPA: MFS transporter [Candidatus Alistipes avistercoris]|jgi:maltose/moltooligosaccharide transporter|uniref:MFS transporter n=1 Tax=Alistipes putredinis TaxID=28117 RepID=UPI001F9B16B4|nr:MFS transporter [uncultured Alistipes sp.]HIX97473.1 MFS transporter [Candidatus Alistipes avistercoris]
MNKPKLSFWQIWNLSFGFLGVQIGYSLQNSNTSSIFESLGADVSHLSYFWLAAPLAGMIIQPIIGLFSDGTWTRLGRRIPYILGGSIVSALALALMPNCPRLLAFAPLAMGAFILLFMDLSFNVTMQPFRALVADMLDDRQKTQGYVVQTFLINLGAVIGAILPLIMTQLGVSDEAEPGSVPEHIAYSYYIGGAILLLTVLVTSFKTREYPPEEFARYNDLKPEPEGPRPGFMTLMRNIPQAMVRLGVTQFFSWAALFLMWTYLKPAITGVVTDHATGEILSAGATQTWVGVLNGTYPIPACIAALFLGRIAARWGNRPVYAACLLLGAAGFAGLCLLHNQYALMIPMVGIGIAWAGILAMPYAILSRAVEPRHMGVYMGIFNFTITIPQIVIGLTGGAIVKYCFASNAVWMLALAGLFMLLAALSVGFVHEEAAR